jgi:cysteine synthase A
VETDNKEDDTDMDSAMSLDGLIGCTPMIEIRSLSKLTGTRIMAKMECRNPGGSGKDRPAKYMLREMAREAKMRCRDVRDIQVVESTSGNTGISLAALCKNLGLELYIVMPDDQSIEKSRKLEALGAKVKVVENCSIANAKHYVNEARRFAAESASLKSGVHLNQFENLANTLAHEETTGPELFRQCPLIDAFVMSAGTGGTIAGVSRWARHVERGECDGKHVEVVLADPQGSSLYHKVMNGVCFAPQQREQKLRKHRYDTIVEGVGLDRVTANFDAADVDSAEKVSDQEMVDMAHWLLHKEGLFVSSSSALNMVAALRVARRLGPGHTVATILCETGQRHLPRFWNPAYLSERGLVWPEVDSLTV